MPPRPRRRSAERSTRVELRPWGIAVSIVEPASIVTAIWQKGATRAEELRAGFTPEVDALYAPAVASFRKAALSRCPGADPDDVAKAVEHALTAGRPKARYLVGARCANTSCDRTLAHATSRAGLANALTG